MVDREVLQYHKDKAAERNANLLLNKGIEQMGTDGIIHSTYASCLKGLHHCCQATVQSVVIDGTRHPVHCDCGCHKI